MNFLVHYFKGQWRVKELWKNSYYMSAFLHIEEFKLFHFLKMFAVHPLDLP